MNSITVFSCLLVLFSDFLFVCFILKDSTGEIMKLKAD